MVSFKDCLSEVREAATGHLEACCGINTDEALQSIPREKALTSISLVAIRLLEQELQKCGTDEGASQHELYSQLKACRKALKSYSARSAAEDKCVSDKKRRRAEEFSEGSASLSSSRGTTAADRAGTSKSIELGQYASSDAFDQNEQKRMKFARLMGGAKVAAQEKGGADGSTRHSTLAASKAELKRMNANLESQFESAMSHKGKKGLGA
ncbi:hypothetical protein, conserved [Leishmania tarentolae]|uniref:Small acidic protein n=1 Tax=Leishmania tarentolae TaxID=5689 RepID=A0A640L0X7_LEITA|nr:hypothetical protein, conserved [Leishmania tarentolae]